MVVYIEVTYLLNALLLFLSFELLSFLCNICITYKEMLKYVLAFNISVLLMYVDFFEGFVILYDLILCLYFFRKQAYIYFPIFIFVYISLLSFFDLFLNDFIVFQCILIVNGLHLTSMMVVVIIFILAIYFYIYYCSCLLKNKDDYVDIFLNDHQYLGFIDNGNKVYYKGYPLMFFNKEICESYRVIDNIEIQTATSKEEIEIIEIDQIMINHQSLHHIYAGLIDELEYDCILSPKLMGGII